MKKLTKFLSAVAIVSSVSIGFAGNSFAKCNYTKEDLMANVPYGQNISMTILSQKEITPNVCEVMADINLPTGQKQVFPFYVISENNKMDGVIIGSYFKDKQNLTAPQMLKYQQQQSESAFKLVAKELNSMVIATYTPPKPNGKILYAFVDPLCPFCHMIEPKLQGLANESHYTVKIMPFIVHGQPAYDKAASFICSKLSYADYIKGDYGNAKVCPQAKELLAKAQKIDAKLNLTGTPTLFTSDGKMVVGADIQQLKTLLGIPNQPLSVPQK